MAVTALAGPAVASAQGSDSVPALPALSDVSAQAEQLSADMGLSERAVQDQVWGARLAIHETLGVLPQSTADQIRGAVDAALDQAFPGLVRERTQSPAQSPAPRQPAPVDRGSCPRTADVCVDIAGKRSWLQENGEISYGPVPISSGGTGQATPRGTFSVNRKVRHEISYEFNNAPMPYAIYFTYNGHAFHQGNVATTSAGCVRLNEQDAAHYFNHVGINDTVYIY